MREFPVLAPRGVPQKVIEVGCGVGNTFFPLLEVNPHVFVYAFDFAASAIDIIKVRWIWGRGQGGAGLPRARGGSRWEGTS